MLESHIEKKCRDLIKSKGGMAIKLDPTGNRGIPDRLILLPGAHVLFAEFKKPGSRPRKNQWHFINELRRLGFCADWYDSIDGFERDIYRLFHVEQ